MVTPYIATLLVDTGANFDATAYYNNCNNAYFPVDVTLDALWDVVLPTGGIASVNAYGFSGTGHGAATVTASYADCLGWKYAGSYCYCTTYYPPKVSSAGVNVDTLVLSISSSGVQGDSAGVKSGITFNLQMQGKSPAGTVPDGGLSIANLSFNVAGLNTSVGESSSFDRLLQLGCRQRKCQTG